MIPPIFETLQASATVRSLLGARPRVFKHGEAPQAPPPRAGQTQADVRPYATWLLISGVPENTLSEAPGIDRDSIQIDVYSKTEAECEAVATAIRDQLETVTHMTALRMPPRDPETKLFRLSMDFDYWLERPA